ncbi:hypothetical protein A3Q56_06933, partial [Intoshia linei]
MSFFKKFVLYQLKRTPEPYNGYLIVDKNVNHALLLFQHSVSVVASSDVKFYKRQFHYFNETFALLGVYDHYIGVNCVSYLVVVTEVEIVGQFKEHDLIKIKEVEFLPLFKDTVLFELPSEVVNLKKLLSLGTFYYAQCKGFNKVEINITQTVNNFNTPDNVNSFLWNRKMMLFFLRRKISVDNWISRVMCGSVQFRRIRTQQHLYYLLISRLSNERVGTRFKSRGINDYGYVANFVETEQLILTTDMGYTNNSINGFEFNYVYDNVTKTFKFVKLKNNFPQTIYKSSYYHGVAYIHEFQVVKGLYNMEGGIFSVSFGNIVFTEQKGNGNYKHNKNFTISSDCSSKLTTDTGYTYHSMNGFEFNYVYDDVTKTFKFVKLGNNTPQAIYKSSYYHGVAYIHEFQVVKGLYNMEGGTEYHLQITLRNNKNEAYHGKVYIFVIPMKFDEKSTNNFDTIMNPQHGQSIHVDYLSYFGIN